MNVRPVGSYLVFISSYAVPCVLCLDIGLVLELDAVGNSTQTIGNPPVFLLAPWKRVIAYLERLTCGLQTVLRLPVIMVLIIQCGTDFHIVSLSNTVDCLIF
jgi:hypothetical protein